MIWWLILIGIIVSIAPVLWLTGIRRRKPGQTEMVLIGAAAGEAEMRTWVAALQASDVQAHVINVGDARWAPEGMSSPYGYEVWVPVRDEARAKQALGFR